MLCVILSDRRSLSVRVPLRLGFLLASIFFLVVNVTCAMLVQDGASESQVKDAVLARVLINDSLFVLCAISLAVCIFKIAKMSSANVYLESKVSGRRSSCVLDLGF